MRIEELKLIPPSKRSSAVLIEFMREHEKGLKAIKTLNEIKEIAESEIDSKEFMIVQCMLNGSVDNKNKILEQILQKIRECEVENETRTDKARP